MNNLWTKSKQYFYCTGLIIIMVFIVNCDQGNNNEDLIGDKNSELTRIIIKSKSDLVLNKLKSCEQYKQIKTTVVLLADDYGQKSTGQYVNRKLVPKAPHWRKSGDVESNYVQDMVDLTNMELADAGYCYGFKIEKYVQMKSTRLNNLSCDDTKTWEMLEKFKNGQKIDFSNRALRNVNKDNFILWIRWGEGRTPSFKGCRGSDSEKTTPLRTLLSWS